LKRSCIGTFSLPGESYWIGVLEKQRGDNDIAPIISSLIYANLFALGHLFDTEMLNMNVCPFGCEIQLITRCLL